MSRRPRRRIKPLKVRVFQVSTQRYHFPILAYYFYQKIFTMICLKMQYDCCLFLIYGYFIQYKMAVVIVLYSILQSASTFFFSYQFNLQSFFKHCILASIGITAYLLACFIKPGFANSENIKLVSSQSELSSSVSTMGVEERTLERGFCRHCKEQQLIRMKHCHDCRKCVATYDHHCIWLSNCIGQKNRPMFLLCLLTNLIEITHAFIAMVAGMVQKGEWLPYQIAFLSFLGILGSGVGLLLALHCYLMASNLTTWESLRWQSIGYLKGLDRRQGSPFNRGIIGNIADYFSVAFQKSFRLWEFNSLALEQPSNPTYNEKEED